jgi:hypothetical protein
MTNRRWIKPGVELLSETLGEGPTVERRRHYQVRLRMTLSGGEPVRWDRPWGLITSARVEDDGAVMITDVRVDRVSLVAGLFYGIQGMRVGGTRTLQIAPHLAYGEEGVPGVVPANAMLRVEITVLSERPEVHWELPGS